MRAPDTILPLRVEGLGFAASGVAILLGVSLAIEAGAPTVILGANGAGKSVLLRLLHGPLAATADRIAWGSARPDLCAPGHGVPAPGAAAPLRAR